MKKTSKKPYGQITAWALFLESRDRYTSYFVGCACFAGSPENSTHFASRSAPRCAWCRLIDQKLRKSRVDYLTPQKPYRIVGYITKKRHCYIPKTGAPIFSVPVWRRTITSRNVPTNSSERSAYYVDDRINLNPCWCFKWASVARLIVLCWKIRSENSPKRTCAKASIEIGPKWVFKIYLELLVLEGRRQPL